MTFDPQLAQAISQSFRSQCEIRLNSFQLNSFEALLQACFGIKNIRNVQLWTRIGAQQRNFINRRLGQEELTLRTFIASKFINQGDPAFVVKTKAFQLPFTSSSARKFFEWINDPYIREYTTRIFFTDFFLIIEYAAQSSNVSEQVDLDSPEFDDVLE